MRGLQLNPASDVFVPDGGDPEAALARCTHLAIGAHPDDVEFMAYHGIAACYGRSDRSLAAVVVTDGAGSARAGAFAGFSNEAMAAARREEQREAARIGRYGVCIQLGFPSAATAARDRSPVGADLAAILGTCRPGTLYVHNPADKHDTHIAVLGACLEALRRLPADRRPDRVLGCEAWRDLDWVPDDRKVVLAVDRHPELARRLLTVFRSQIEGGKRYDLAVEGRRLAHATFHDPHRADAAAAVTFALDLTPLTKDDGPTLEAFMEGMLGGFREDVLERLRRIA